MYKKHNQGYPTLNAFGDPALASAASIETEQPLPHTLGSGEGAHTSRTASRSDVEIVCVCVSYSTGAMKCELSLGVLDAGKAKGGCEQKDISEH